jgi:hypothetical protein
VIGVVNGTDGQPIAGAKIELYDQRYDFKTKKDKRIVHARLTTDENGEAYFKNVDGNVLISTSNDKFTPAKDIYLSRTRYYEQKDDKIKHQLFTDREAIQTALDDIAPPAPPAKSFPKKPI